MHGIALDPDIAREPAEPGERTGPNQNAEHDESQAEGDQQEAR